VTGWATLGVMGAVCFTIALFLWAVIAGAKKQGAAEANADAEKRQTEAMKQSNEVKDERLARMADAAAASVSEPADSVRERMRKRPANTR
jgi:hypothetical protein